MAVELSMPVLVVDDYEMMVRIVRNLLTQLGFVDVDHAGDGSSALAKMRGKTYGLVISDWGMEPMVGRQLLREVRADPKLSATPVIIVTPETRTENAVAAKSAGADECLLKPFNLSALQNKIEAALTKRLRVPVADCRAKFAA